MRIDPELARALADRPRPPAGAAPPDLPTLRARISLAMRHGHRPQPGEDQLEVAERSVAHGVRVRTYRPQQHAEPLPGVLTVHGGGFRLGDLDFNHSDSVAIALAVGLRRGLRRLPARAGAPVCRKS